jgi:hypothetical protein
MIDVSRTSRDQEMSLDRSDNEGEVISLGASTISNGNQVISPDAKAIKNNESKAISLRMKQNHHGYSDCRLRINVMSDETVNGK